MHRAGAMQIVTCLAQAGHLGLASGEEGIEPRVGAWHGGQAEVAGGGCGCWASVQAGEGVLW